MRSDSNSSLPPPDAPEPCSVRSRRLFRTIAIRRSISTTAADGGGARFTGRTGRLATGAGFLRTATFFFTTFFFAAFFAFGRGLAVFDLVFATERREEDFFFAAMVPS